MHNEMIEGFRLSPQQQRLWMLQQHSDSFRAECAVLVEGALKRDVLVEALRRVVMRHEILRTDFRMMPGVDLPWQIIGEEALAALREVEFDKKGDLRQQLEACLREESAQTTFDAEHGTPLRALLAKVDEQRHLLALSLPSLCADAWSLKNLLRDIVQLYAATAAGEELEDEAVQYVDFSEWQYELLESEDKRAGREFWQLQQQETADLPQFILPLEYRAAATEYRPETLTVEVEAEELRRIESLARGREVTTEAVLLACWQIFLWRATGSSEFVVHTAFDGGKYTDLRGSVGLFTKHLPLRAILDEGGTLGDTAQRVGQTHKEAYRRQEYFNQGRAEDAPESDSGIGFEYEEWPESLRAAQLTFTLSHLAVCSESFKLKLTASRTAEGLRLTFTYDSSLFSTEGVRDWAAGYQTLLRNALDAPDAPASSLLAMGEGERLRLLQDWCGHTDTYTHGDSSAHAFTSILDAFDHYVRLAPLHTAVVHDAASLSFSDLDARANQLAHLLRSRGLGPDSIAAIALERGVEMLVALLAVWKAGGAYLPLDPAQPSRRLAFMIEDAKARILITRQHLAGALSSDASHIICLDADRDEIDRQSRDNPTPLTRPEHLAYVIYTSGSTGKPKGVMVEHGSLLNLHDALRRTLYRDIADLGIDGGGEQETPQRLRVSLNAPLYFDASVKQLVQLLSGHTLVVIPEELRADARGLLDYLKQQQVDVLDCTPSLLRPLLLEGLTEGAAPSLRAVLSGGEAIDAALWGEMAVAAAPAFYNLYGPTECTVDATWRRVTGEGERPVLGRPLPNTQVYILDGRGQLAATGAAGELCIGGVGVSRGYLNRPALTAERFVPHPWGSAGARLYRTGDRARFTASGEVEYLGRVDRQVKVRGYRVELGEVESALRRQAGVRQAAVVLRGEEGTERMVAYLAGSRRGLDPLEGASSHRLPDGRRVAHCNRNETDYLYEELFSKRSYFRHGVALPSTNACVFDVGANIGLFTLLALGECERARVYAFEPLAEVSAALRRNARAHGRGSVKVFGHGLSDVEREAEFTYYPRYTMMSGQREYSDSDSEVGVIERYLENERAGGDSSAGELLAHSRELLEGRFEERGESCRLRRLADVIREEGVEWIDLLKVDVQRAEMDVLLGLGDEDWAKVWQVVMEVHDGEGEASQGRVRELTRMLGGRGFEVVAEQDELLEGTDRWNLYAVREGYEQARAEREAVLLGEVGSAQASVEQKEWGSGEAWGAEPEAEAMPEVDAVRSALARELPDYMLPSAFILLESLPLTRNGKVDYSSLPSPEETATQTDDAGQTLTPVEELLSGIWASLLKRQRVGLDENFFDLGGHSLLATQLVSRLREAFQVEVSLRSLFEHPTLSGLASVVDAALREGSGASTAPPVTRVSRDGALPLSFAQQRLWFIDQLEGSSPFYNSPAAVRLTGTLDTEALQRTLTEMVSRHESLRTRFVSEGGEPLQVIDEAGEVSLPVTDLTELGEEEREEEARRMAGEEARLAFDLSRGPLLRARLLRLGEEEHVALFTMHHIISDGWSMGVLIREVAALYEAFSRGEESPLSELPVQYGDYAVWQREWLRGEVLERQLSYWRSRLGGELPVLELPCDRPRPAVQSYRGAHEPFAVSEELSQRLRELSRQEGATLYMTMLAAFQVLLSRYTGQEDVLVGTDIANRQRGESEGLIGFFVNQLVMRGDVSGDRSFREMMKRARECALGAYAHQDVPFEKLVEELGCGRDLSHTPLFQVKLVLQNSSEQGLTLPGLELSPLHSGSGAARFDLTVIIGESPNGRLGGVWTYSTDLFEAETIRRMQAHFERLLEAAVATPDAAISRLQFLSVEEREQLAERWNRTATEYPRHLCAHELFEAQVAATPEALAVVYKDERVTYAELNRRANQLAHYLRELGVGPEVLVGVLAERSVEMVVAVLGVLKAGGAYVPLDPQHPLERLAWMLEDTALPVLLMQERLAERVPSHWGQTLYLDTEWESVAAYPDADPADVAVTPENLAYVIYTSGSTGRPKGTQIEHRGVVNYLCWSRDAYGIEAGVGAPVHTSLSFDLTVTSLFGPLVSGGWVELLSDDADVEALGRALVERGGYGVVKLTPSHLRLLSAQFEALSRLASDEPTREQALAVAADGARALVIGGEKLTVEAVRWWQEYAPQVRLFNEYGPTETVVGCCVYELKGDERSGGVIPIGRPIANTRLYILDSHSHLVPVGVVGELYIGGDGVARGYLNRKELTEEKFIADPFSKETGARLYRTGDLARYLADGEIEYVGRVDEQVKLRGYRIEPGEIEASLCEHPCVRECAVILREDAGDRRLVAYVVAGDEAHADELRRYAKAQLPDYMVPSAFVMLESLPLTTNGKLDRKALPAPEQGGTAADSYVAPRTPVEEVLAGVWAEVLRVERVGADDNFFDLGGHSLLATQLLSRIREAFAVEVSLKSLFESPTVAGVAVCVEAARRDDDASLQAPSMTRASRDGVLPLSFAQQRLWFLSRLEPESAFYNTPAAMRVAGRLDVSALESALSELIRRHEALRTRFVEIDGRPAQVIDEARPVRLRTTDLGACADDEREAEALRLATEEARRPFDLAAGPLLRAGLLRLSEEEHVVLFTLHHIISDGWSHGILINEVRALYEAFAQGRPSPLAELELQYADYAVWQRRWLSGEVLEAQLDYWRRQLAGAPTMLEMPTDRPRPAVQTFNGARASVVIEWELRDALDRLSRREGSTLYMTLLAAFQVLLCRYSEQTDVVVGSPVANRNRREIEGLIGFFANTLVLRTSLDGNPSFQELLGRVREVALGAYMHQDVPFEKLVEELQPERSLSHQPLFQVLFNFLTAQNAAALQAGASAQPRLTARSLNEGSRTAKFDLNLALVEAERELVGSLEYNTDLYDHATVERMLKHFKILLESIAADPVQPLSALLASIPRQKLSVAIASTFTSEPVAESLGFWMEQLRVPCKFRFAAFNQVFQELLDPSSLLATNEGGVNVILVRLEDWLGEGLSQDAAACRALESHVEEFLRVLRSAARRSPVGHLLGVDDSLGSPLNDEAVACLRRMKQRLTEEATALEGVYVLDMPEAFRLYGVREVHDQYANKVGSVPYTPEAYAALGTALARRLHALRRSPYKVIVLDCDNTLWKGVCGEDGPSGVCVDAPFEALQQMMLKQYEAGTLLCISSKNNEEDVLEVFRQHPEMPLKLEHFVARQIHWGAKSESLKALAAELNLSLDSFVFIDDDALVCAEVRNFCPEVLTLQLPAEPAEIAPFLEHVWAFDRLKMTVEDEQRSLFYRQNHEREQLERESLGLEDFLSGLSLDIRIASVQPHQLERVSQLTHRTNQFNATTVRRSAAELQQLLEGGRAECLAVEVSDRFGSYGLVGAVIYEPTTDALEVDTFLLSCRALGRHVEDNMLVRLLKLAAERGLNTVRVPFRRTERNAPAFNFLNRLEAERMTTGEDEVFVFPTSRLADPSLVETAYGYRFHQEAAAETAPNVTSESAPANRDAAETVDRVGRDVLERKNRVLHRIADSFRTASRIVEVIRAETMQIRTEPSSCVPARTPLEDILVNMWADLLKLDRVGVFDNFFKLGGHSLLATQMVSRIQKVLQVELPLRSVFEEPTIAELALRIEAAQRTETGTQSLPLVPVSREQHLPVSFQQGMVLKRIYRDKEQNSFNIRKSVGIQGRPDIAALEASFAEIIRRHESLRTSFAEVDGQWMQVINPPSNFKLSLIDLRELPEVERGKEVQRLAGAEIARRFDLLSDNAVLRASLVRLADEEYALIIILHHIAGDGWSIGLVIKELSELYRAHAVGEASTLPELSLQYADYAYWQNRQLQGEAYEELLSYWTRQLDGMPYTLELPTDYPRPLTPVGRVNKERLTLTPAMVGDLNELSRREGVSLYILLLAAYKTMLYRHAGLEDILVWADIANRHHAELEGVIGYLSNEIVFRTKLSGDLTFRELLERVREMALGAYRHQALPYSVIEQSMEGKVDPSASPLLQFSFSMQNASNGSPTTLPGLGLRPIIIEDEERGMSGELEMNVYENERGVVGVLSYNANLFKPETARAMMNSLAALLASIVADPEQSLDSLSCEEDSLISA